MAEPVFQSIVVRSSTPPAAEKVNFWFTTMSGSPPTRPPSSHNSEFDTPAMDPSQWKAPTMDTSNPFRYSPAPEQFVAQTPTVPVIKPAHSPAVFAIPVSPPRSNGTALLQDELNGTGDSVPDYNNDGLDLEQSHHTQQPGSVVGDLLKSPKSPNFRHHSSESFGNLGAPRDSTFGTMIIQPTEGLSRTPNLAAGVPLPAQSDWDAMSRSGAVRSPAPPSVVGITVEAPSEAHQSTVESAAAGHPQDEEGSEAGTEVRSKANTARGASVKAPSVASPQQSHRSRAFSPPRSERSRGNGGAMNPAAFVLPSGGATNYERDSRPPTEFRGTPMQVPLPMGAGTTYSAFSPSVKSANRLASPPQTPMRSVKSGFDNRLNTEIYKAPTEGSVADSLATERSAARSNKLSSYQPSAAGGGARSHFTSTPMRESVALHPLTPQARSQASQLYSPHPQSASEVISPEDRLHAAIRGRAIGGGSQHYQPSVQSQVYSPQLHHEGLATPHTRTQSPELNEDEQRLVDEALMRTPRTSYTIAPSVLAAEVQRSHFHDNELCLLLHAADDPTSHEVVRRAMRKAIKNRLKKLGLKHDNDAVSKYRDTHSEFHARARATSPQPVVVHVQQPEEEVAPAWARGMMEALQSTQDRIEKLDNKLSARGSVANGALDTPYSPVSKLKDSEYSGRGMQMPDIRKSRPHSEQSPYLGPAHTEIETIPAESIDESVREPTIRGHEDDDRTETNLSRHHRNHSQYTPPHQDSEAQSISEQPHEGHSPGQQYLEEELYKLRVKPSQSERSHNTWEVAREGQGDNEPGITEHSESEMPEIPDSEHGAPTHPGGDAAPIHERPWDHEWHPDSDGPPPWQRIHQTLLNWAIVWPMSELDQALNSTLRGHQVNEVALSIWVTQTYKRYVRTRMMDHPRQTVDRLFVPPNIADAINNAVFNGRHGDAAGMLRDMWNPYGLEGMPRLLVVLARHRKDQNHWVVHRFSLPDGGLTTYDSFPERALPDGRPLGWWFAIRIAWPHALYPSPDHLVQKIVRLHRPMQLLVDNSVAAAGVWRNILMGSRAERSIDLERLRDLINTEVRNLRQRKEMGKLSISAPKPNWEEIVGA